MAGWTRGQDGRRMEIIFYARNVGVRQDAVAPHSTTAAQRTDPASAPHAAHGDPLIARPAGFGHSRAAASAGETAGQGFSSGLRRPQDGQEFGGDPGAGGLPEALAPHSTTTAPHKTTPALAPRAAQIGPLEAPPVGLGHSRARITASASEPTEQDYSSGLADSRNGQPFENIFSRLDAGSVQDSFGPPSVAA